MITSVLPSGTASPNPMTNDATKPTRPSRNGRPRSLSKSSSRPARNSRSATPSCEKTVMTLSSATQFRSAGPMTIPAAISSTEDGMGSDGTRPRSSGTATATTITIMTSSKASPRSGTGPTVPARSTRTIDAMADQLPPLPDAALPDAALPDAALPDAPRWQGINHLALGDARHGCHRPLLRGRARDAPGRDDDGGPDAPLLLRDGPWQHGRVLRGRGGRDVRQACGRPERPRHPARPHLVRRARRARAWRRCASGCWRRAPR